MAVGACLWRWDIPLAAFGWACNPSSTVCETALPAPQALNIYCEDSTARAACAQSPIFAHTAWTVQHLPLTHTIRATPQIQISPTARTALGSENSTHQQVRWNPPPSPRTYLKGFTTEQAVSNASRDLSLCRHAHAASDLSTSGIRCAAT